MRSCSTLLCLRFVEQRMRYAVLRPGQEDRGAGHAHGGRRLDALDEQVERHRVLGEAPHQHHSSALPRRQQREHEDADQDWKPAAVGNLERVRRQEREIDERQGVSRWRRASHTGQFHNRSITTKIRIESISMASVTAMP